MTRNPGHAILIYGWPLVRTSFQRPHLPPLKLSESPGHCCWQGERFPKVRNAKLAHTPGGAGIVKAGTGKTYCAEAQQSFS